MPAGVYISMPFCRSKCTYCNFASGVFSAEQMGRYIERLATDVASFGNQAAQQGAQVPATADSIYLGGGTPTLLQPQEIKNLFLILRDEFDVASGVEITVECAPGTLADEKLGTLAACGVNRVSLGVQSFVDREAASVARLHTQDIVRNDIDRLRAWGISNINVDLIAGLPHQTHASWNDSLAQVIASGVPHVSVYMLEIDQDSRLGRELIGGGTKYHALFVPDDDIISSFYEDACAKLDTAGVHQYEISNFARPGFESRHNLKYWTRQPYLGFGVDAHSMLPASEHLRTTGVDSLRFSTTDSLDRYLTACEIRVGPVTAAQAVEESFFLGLRLNRGVSLDQTTQNFGVAVAKFEPVIEDLVADGLLDRRESTLRLTLRGRLLSNDVFEKFIS